MSDKLWAESKPKPWNWKSEDTSSSWFSRSPDKSVWYSTTMLPSAAPSWTGTFSPVKDKGSWFGFFGRGGSGRGSWFGGNDSNQSWLKVLGASLKGILIYLAVLGALLLSLYAFVSSILCNCMTPIRIP